MTGSFTGRKSDIVAFCITIGILIANVAACYHYPRGQLQSTVTSPEVLRPDETIDSNSSEDQSATPHNETTPSLSSSDTGNTSISSQTSPAPGQSNLIPTGGSVASNTPFPSYNVAGDSRRSSSWSSLRSVRTGSDSDTQVQKNERSYRTLIELVRCVQEEVRSVRR